MCLLPHQFPIVDIHRADGDSVIFRDICNNHVTSMFGLREEAASLKISASDIDQYNSADLLLNSEDNFERLRLVAHTPWQRTRTQDLTVFNVNDVVIPSVFFCNAKLGDCLQEMRTKFPLKNHTSTKSIISKPLDQFINSILKSNEMQVNEKPFNVNPRQSIIYTVNYNRRRCEHIAEIYLFFLRHFLVTTNIFPSAEDKTKHNQQFLNMYFNRLRTFNALQIYKDEFQKSYEKIVQMSMSGMFYNMLNAIDVPVSENNGRTKYFVGENSPNVAFHGYQGIIATRPIIHGEELVLNSDGFLDKRDFFRLKVVRKAKF